MASPFTLVSATDAYSNTDWRTLYTVPAGKQAFIKSVIAANIKNSNTVPTLEMLDGGVTPVQLAKPTLAGNASSNLLAGTLVLSAGESLRQKSDSNLLVFNNLVHTATGTSYSNPNISDFIYANGTYVAVGYRTGTDPYNNFVLTSTDGINWTWRDVDTGSSTQRFINSVAYGAGLFVVVGEGGFIATSPNGTTWTTRTSAQSVQINHVIYAGGKFVAVGGNTTANSIQTSTDGITWTARTGAVSPSSYNFAQVAYDATIGLYVMSSGNSASSGSGIQTSPDGITWTARTVPVGNNVLGVQAKPGLFLLKTNTSSVWLKSVDGINWTESGTNSTYAEGINQFKYINGLFVATSNSSIAWSADGLIWQEASYQAINALARPIPLYDGTNWFFASFNPFGTIYKLDSLSTNQSQTVQWTASVIEVSA
jgi:hypothetical protein